MFGGFDHLSKAAEAQSRQTRAAAPVDNGPRSIEEMMSNLKLKADGNGRLEGEVTRDEMMEFFAKNQKTLSDPQFRQRLSNLARDPKEKLKLNMVLIAAQKDHFLEMGINPEFGCQFLGSIDKSFASDMELLSARNQFVDLCYETFLAIIRASVPSQLQSTGSMSREQILMFLDACEALFNSPSTHARLHKHYLKTKDMPSQLCIEMQHDMMESLGFERVFGVQCLNRVMTDFPNDEMLGMKLHNFQLLCTQAVRQASISPEDAQRQRMRSMQAQSRAAADEAEDTGRTGPKLTREEVMEFLTRNEEKLASEPVRTKLKKLAKTDEGKSDLNRVLIELQRSVFSDMGINKNFGVSCLNSAGIDFAGDTEVVRSIQHFATACSKAWLTAIDDARPNKLQAKGKLTRTQLVNFADACNNYVNQPECREILRAKYLETGDIPSEVMADLQLDIFERLGIERMFGKSCLSRFPKDFPGDQALFQKIQSVEQMSRQAIAQAKLTDEQLLQVEEQNIREAQEKVQMQQANKDRMIAIQTAVQNMSQEEKDALKAKILPKWKTLMRLPNQERASYLQRQSAGDQLDFAKINLIMVQDSMKSADPQATMRSYIEG